MLVAPGLYPCISGEHVCIKDNVDTASESVAH